MGQEPGLPERNGTAHSSRRRRSNSRKRRPKGKKNKQTKQNNNNKTADSCHGAVQRPDDQLIETRRPASKKMRKKMNWKLKKQKIIIQ